MDPITPHLDHGQRAARRQRLDGLIQQSAMKVPGTMRTLGLRARAERDFAALPPEVRALLERYADGVNAYIQTLTPKTMPFEYKLLDYAPEPWEPLKCALILKYMAFDLSGRSVDLRMSNALAKYGPVVV